MSTKKAAVDILVVRVERVRNTSDSFSVYTGRVEREEPADANVELLGAFWDKTVTVKQFAGPVRQLQRWCIAGKVVEDPRWGSQFVAQFATLATPRSDRDLESFLTSGLVDGWDFWAYHRLVGATEGERWQLCRDHPEQLLEIEGITPEMVANLQQCWRRGSGLAEVYAQLADWGCTGRQSDALVKYYGFATIEKLTEDPYKDILEINGYGWKTAENVAMCVGMPKNDPKRIRAGLDVAVHERTWQSGDTWLSEDSACRAAGDLLVPLGEDAIDQQLAQAIADGHLLYTEGRIYPERLYQAEQTIAAQIARRAARADLPTYGPFDVDSADDLSPEQWTAVCTALNSSISLLTGGPGTGKTTALRTLIGNARHAGLSVTCMAPTGKAAARMTEATGYPAATIHSRLRITPGIDLPADDLEPVTGMVIVDEVSMLDTGLAAAMLTRISPLAQILLVGDPDQLPSVGPGAVLRDLIAADCMPRVHLDHVYRNDAGVAINAGRMRAGENILSLPDCEIVPAETQLLALARIHDALEARLRDGKQHSDVLVLTPTNDGPCGRLALNTMLQDLLSPSLAGTGIVQYAGTSTDPDGTIRKRSEELRRGDRVMVTKNSSDLGVFNGQVGTVVDVIVPRSLDVEIDGQVITFAGENKRLLTLAYAITGHKSQGSEAPIVIAPIFKSRVLSREWLYTVVTRARESCTLIGDPDAIQGCIRVRRAEERRTGLVEALAKTVGTVR